MKIRRFYPKQAHRDIHRSCAIIEMPVNIFREAVALAKNLPDPMAAPVENRVMAQCESHPSMRLLCDWWNKQAPDESTRRAGYAMAWERVGDSYECGYCETPSARLQKFMPLSKSFARIGDDILIEFWQGAKAFTYDGWLGLQTWRVNGERGWTCGKSEDDVLSGKYDEAWYALEGLRSFKERNSSQGNLVLTRF